MPSHIASTPADPSTAWTEAPSPPPPTWVRGIGRFVLNGVLTVQGLGAFALITLGVVLRQMRHAPPVIGIETRKQLTRSVFGVATLVFFLSLAMGFVVIGQMVAIFSRVGVNDWMGTVMVTVVVRELGPLLTALLVLTRTGTAFVIELATARAQGEVEALEVLGIDPIHYLVVPRVLGLSLAIFSLTVYLILGTLGSGYLWAFLEDVPLTPGDYFSQLANALEGMDFVMLALKSILFGAGIAIVTCYHGLAQPVVLGQVSHATVRAVSQGVGLCVILDALFLLPYLFL